MFQFLIFLVASILVSFSAHAQSSPFCDMKTEPHSYACHQWNFNGNAMFPLTPIDWYNVIEGSWKALTYANPWSENIGPEFRMSKDPKHTQRPLGVINRLTKNTFGDLVIRGNTMTFKNWQGSELVAIVDGPILVDAYTFRFQFSDGEVMHAFSCRDFLRNDIDHLICSWDVQPKGAYWWEHHGFFGFLRR